MEDSMSNDASDLGDILDIDEALKDDSFIFLEEKAHDDVSNIIQQWKSNFGPVKPQLAAQGQEQAKLNSRTFTRPKRRISQNLESQFSNTSHTSSSEGNEQLPVQPPLSLNMEIGGWVSTMHKSFLQDTSPPLSIASSMEVSVDRMNNSLITSADFSNLNFLQSTNSMTFEDNDYDYKLSDVIRDRKMLEALTMSGEAAIIKDSQIAQIDDISLAFSKTASGCSTMNNSTESVEGNNCTIINHNIDKTIMIGSVDVVDEDFDLPAEKAREPMTVDMLLDITHNVVSDPDILNETFKKPLPLNETVCYTQHKINTTFDCDPSASVQSIGTPESKTPSKQFEISTPVTHRVATQGRKNTSLSRIMDEENISPITASDTTRHSYRAFNETFDKVEQEPFLDQCGNQLVPDLNIQALDSNSDEQQSPDVPVEKKTEEKVRDSSLTYRKNHREFTDTRDIALEEVMDLAKAEAKLLVGNDDEAEFEQMLDNFSKISLSAEQQRLKRSLETIKKRFNYSGNIEKCENYENSMKTMWDDEPQQEASTGMNKSFIKESADPHRITVPNMTSSSSGNERLLSRRSRLYDDINLSTFPKDAKLSSTSFIIHKHDAEQPEHEHERAETKETELFERMEEKTEDLPATTTTACDQNGVEGHSAEDHKLNEKRIRNRDRFKTIKIDKQRTFCAEEGALSGLKINVPCIDDLELVRSPSATETEADQSKVPLERYTRRDSPRNSTVFNNNKSETQKPSKLATKAPTNYLTYKKPKEKSPKANIPEIYAPSLEYPAPASSITREPRSISRGPFTSGLRRPIMKATSDDNVALNTTGHLRPGEGGDYRSKHADIAEGESSLLSSAPKSKSVHNLAGHTTRRVPPLNNRLQGPDPGGFGFRRNEIRNSTLAEKKVQQPVGGKHVAAKNTVPNPTGVKKAQQPPADSTFKAPTSRLVSGIRAPAGSGANRTGLVRPSSGYFSMGGVKVGSNSNDFEINARSLSESMSSNSSRGSAQSAGSNAKPFNNSKNMYRPQSTIGNPKNGLNKPPAAATRAGVNAPPQPPTLTKFTTGGTGIPKPSGLKPPTNIKRSALPRPSSVPKR